MDVTEIVLTLITKGTYNGDISEYICEVNKRLKPIFYEAVMVYDKSCCILKNNSNRFIPSDYSEQDNNEIKRVLEHIITDRPVESYIIDSLVANRWLERDKDKFFLSNRALIQFEDYILSLEGRYVKCGLCRQLVDGQETHEYCKGLLNNPDL